MHARWAQGLSRGERRDADDQGLLVQTRRLRSEERAVVRAIRVGGADFGEARVEDALAIGAPARGANEARRLDRPSRAGDPVDDDELVTLRHAFAARVEEEDLVRARPPARLHQERSLRRAVASDRPP